MVCMRACCCSVLTWRHLSLYVCVQQRSSRTTSRWSRVCPSLSCRRRPTTQAANDVSTPSTSLLNHTLIFPVFLVSIALHQFIVLLSRIVQVAKRARRPWCRKASRCWEIYVDDVIKIMWNFDKISFNCCKTTASNDCDINVQAQTTAIFQFDFIVTCTVN